MRSIGVQEHITEISSDMYFNTIEINFQPYLNDVEAKPYVEKLKSFVNDICPMPITLDLSNYKEKIQYAQSMIDRLIEEFRL